jgi:hypothetical protein
MPEQSVDDHLKEAEMILNDMQRPIEQRYAGAQAHAMLALVKVLRHRQASEED